MRAAGPTEETHVRTTLLREKICIGRERLESSFVGTWNETRESSVLLLVATAEITVANKILL